MKDNENSAHTFTEGTDVGAYQFTKPSPDPLDIHTQYASLEDQYKEHKAKAREHTAAASEINKKMKALDAERRRQERRLKDILES